MTVEARYNLQKGVPEDTRFEATTYTSDGSALDNWLLARMKLRKQYEKYMEQKQLEAFDKKLEKHIEKTIDGLLKELEK